MLRRLLMTLTDIGMLAHWAAVGAMSLGLLEIPSAYLFTFSQSAHEFAWSWSFFPIHMLLAISGLWALRLEGRHAPNWRIWSAISMTLTACAGLIAVTYWAIIGEFDLLWWSIMAVLALWPLPFLFQLGRLDMRP